MRFALALVLSGVVSFQHPPSTRRVRSLHSARWAKKPNKRFDLRFNGVGIPGSELGFVLLEAVRQGGGIKTGDLVIAGADVPAQNIVQSQSYELLKIYWQGSLNNTIQRIDVERLDSPPPAGCEGYEQYISLYSPRYHAESGPVIVRPEEARLVRLRDEVADSLWLAIPGLFWVWVAYSFVQYGRATGRM